MDATPALHPDRVMPFHVLLYVTQGAFSVVEDGEEYTVEAGHLLFMHAGVHHYGIHPCSRDRKWYYVHFYPQTPYAEDFSSSALPLLPRLDFKESDYHYNFVLPKTLDDSRGTIERALREIILQFSSRDPLRHIRSSLLLYTLLIDISLTMRDANKPRYSPHVESLIHYLDEHMSQAIHAEKLSEEFQLNYRYLSGLFHQETQTTVQDYLRRLRINKACQLLRYTSMNIREVGESVGYTDPCHFSHVFKQVRGISPREFLMRYKQDISYSSQDLE